MKYNRSELIEAKRRALKPKFRDVSETELEQLAAQRDRFRHSLSWKLSHCKYPLAVIAEMRTRNPFAPSPRDPVDVLEESVKLAAAGVDALAYWVDGDFFEGDPHNIRRLEKRIQAESREVPCIYQDVLVHPIQIVEALQVEASAISIFVDMLQPSEIDDLYVCALTADIDCVFVVQNNDDLDRCLAFDPKLICVNNIDPRTGEADLSISRSVLPRVPKTSIGIAWGGIHNKAEAQEMKQIGADVIMIGNALLECEDPEQLIGELHSCSL
jgi:indole-3-glycerol phosphate synthase